MKFFFVLALLCWPAFQATQLQNEKPRSVSREFKLQIEETLDYIDDIDVSAGNLVFEPKMTAIKNSAHKLGRIASGDDEKQSARDVSSLVFFLDMCRMQAVSHADTHTCVKQIDDSEKKLMKALAISKVGGVWD